MIQQRIARQYSHHCEETNFKPFSKRTMLCVLPECKAFVRKSLQGLDYFAADGARAFEDLNNLVRQLGDLGLGNEWQVQHVELLKAAKSYIKGDFKVMLIAALRQRDLDETDIKACEEEINFTQAKEAVETIQLQHPLVYDQYDLCAMAMEGNLKNLKLPMLQRVCEDLGLDVSISCIHLRCVIQPFKS